MENKSLYDLALNIATKAHEGVEDKGGTDYIQHPITVSRFIDRNTTQPILKGLMPYFTDEMIQKAKIIALLHDVIEDSIVTFDDLRNKGIPEDICDVVLLLTNTGKRPYEVYIEGIKANPLACLVKIADMVHNSDLSRLKAITPHNLHKAEDYKLGIMKLSKHLKDTLSVY